VAAARTGAELLVDAYHALGPVPFDVPALGLEAAWVVGGGYKYLQLGEGNCFLRVPAQGDRMRPVVTGWYAEFAALAERAPHAGDLRRALHERGVHTDARGTALRLGPAPYLSDAQLRAAVQELGAVAGASRG
jgi:kynureninase